MKKIIVTTTVLASTMAFAGDYKINVEGRSDLTMNTTKTTPVTGAATETKYTSFKNNMVRLNMFAQVNDSLSFRFRQRFTNDSAAAGTTLTVRDNSTSNTDFIYVDHKNSFFTTRFGKQSWSNAAGRESMVGGSDVFITSDALTNFRSAVGEYRFGASALVSPMEGHNLVLALSNPNAAVTDTSASASKNNAVAYGVYYTGSLMEKMVQPTFGLTIAPQDKESTPTAGSETKKANYTLMSFGLRSEVSGLVFDADYKTFTKANRNAGTNVAAVKETTKAMYFNASYGINEFTPFFTYTNDKYTKENNATSNYKRNAMALGVLYKPFADVNFRYHLAYTSATKKIDATTGTKETKDNNILFGIKADI